MGTELLALLLGGGGVAMVTALVRAYRTLREGSRAAEEDAYATLGSQRRNETTRANWAESERDWWHRRAAQFERVIIINLGPDKVPPPTEPFPNHGSEDD